MSTVYRNFPDNSFFASQFNRTTVRRENTVAEKEIKCQKRNTVLRKKNEDSAKLKRKRNTVLKTKTWQVLKQKTF